MAEIKGSKEKSSIFSKEALDKLRSPEKLDTVLPITTPIGWMGLAGVAVMMVAVVIWSIFGSFTVKAEGMGMIMDSSGLSKVSSIAGGRVDKLYVHSGEKIKKGELVAHLELPQETAATRMAQYSPELASSNRDAENRVHEFDSRRYQKEATEYIYSPYSGTVDEIMVEQGHVLGSGTPIITVRNDDGRNELSGIMYVSVNKGKSVKPGMTIQIAPGGVDISQSGCLLGTVRSVSQYPVSAQSMQTSLGNEQVVQTILQAQQGAVMEVIFDLVKDPGSESGYLWTSSVGEHKPITAGSFCTGTIIIERRPPIEKVFYRLSQWLRNR